MAIGFLVLTRSTMTPFDNIGVMTMKMMSITSITSTMGVTLMSAIAPEPCRRFFAFSSLSTIIVVSPRQEREAPCGASPLTTNQLATASVRPLLAGAGATLRTLQEVVDQLGAGVAYFHVERFNLPGKVVEHPDRRDSHEQADSGGHEGFRNAARHRGQTGGLFVRNALERVDDADHRSEQTHERGRRTDRRQAADAALQFGVNDGFGALQSTFGRFDLFTRDLRADLVRLEFLETGHNHLRQMALFVAVGNLHRLIQFALAQCARHGWRERAGLFAGRAVSHQSIDHDADGIG